MQWRLLVCERSSVLSEGRCCETRDERELHACKNTPIHYAKLSPPHPVSLSLHSEK